MIGEHIQHYRVIRQLGAGGMGVVYEAEDTRLGRHVALKFLPESVTASTEVVERFEREARTLASLNHPNICAIYDIGSHEGRSFIVMELLDGEPLRDHITGQPLPLEQIVELGYQLADALDAAHEKGIVHRDIKPANIFITKRGQAKLLDFGIAKLGGDQMAHTPADETRMSGDALTSPGMAVGSVNYMSPEQARGEELDGRTDLFSLGLVLYEMATGQQAFGGQTTAVVFDALLNRQPPEPRLSNPELPDDLQRIIMRSLEKDRRMRFQTAADMLAELGRARRDSTSRTGVATAAPMTGQAPMAPGTAATAPAAAATGKRPGWLVAAGIAVPALAVIGYILWGGGTPTPAFTERDTILVADFVNSTADDVFNDALKQAVAVQLQQTPFVTLLPDRQVQRTLQLMQRGTDEPVTGDLARELCQRAGAKATVEGSISPIGSAYVMTLGVHNCETGESLAQEQVQADAKEEVLETLGTAVMALRQRLGESLSSIERYDVPVTEASTASLEALRTYGQGLRARVTQGDDEALPFFEQAIEFDPDFALAHAKLAVIHGNRGRMEEARQHALRAYELRDKVSEYERLYIQWLHARQILEDEEESRQALNLMLASYPRDFTALNNLGVYHMGQAEYEQASELFMQAADVQPAEPLPLTNAAYALFFQNRHEEAYEMTARALALRPDGGLAVTRWTAALVTADPRLAEFEAEARELGDDDQVFNTDFLLAVWRGRLEEFEQLASKARARLQGQGDEISVMQIDLNRAIMLAAMHPSAHLRDLLQAMDVPGLPPEARAQAAGVAAALGAEDEAMAALSTVDTESARVEISSEVAVIRAYAAAADGDMETALAALENVTAAYPQVPDLPMHLAIVQQRAGRYDEAAENFEAVLDAVMRIGATVPIMITKVYLAEVRIAQDRPDEARAILDQLLEQWKDADTEFDLLVRARELREKLG